MSKVRAEQRVCVGVNDRREMAEGERRSTAVERAYTRQRRARRFIADALLVAADAVSSRCDMDAQPAPRAPTGLAIRVRKHNVRMAQSERGNSQGELS